MIIDCAHYQDGRRRDEGPVPLDEAAARCREGGFVWLGLFEPGEEELAQVRDTFGLHELAVEDAQNFHMRPKIESYDQDVRLVILRTARYDDAAEEVEFGEISVFLAPAFVITVRQGVASELRGARQRLEQRPELLAAGSSSALWAILDQVVDDYAPVVAGLEHDIDQIEATVFSGAVAPTERIYSLRREATDFYRAVHPLLAVVTTIERATEAPQLQPVPARRPGPPAAGQRGGRRAARPARHGAGGQHGGDLGRADQGQRPAERHHRAAHHPGHGLPAADLHHRVLRPELRLAGRAHRTASPRSPSTASAAWWCRWRCCSCGSGSARLMHGPPPRLTATESAVAAGRPAATANTTTGFAPSPAHSGSRGQSRSGCLACATLTARSRRRSAATRAEAAPRGDPNHVCWMEGHSSPGRNAARANW